jgi:hypothetical protein
MYTMSKFLDRQMFACSIPPSANEQLSEGFRELSRIHFYLGHAPIDFMIDAVEKASLKDIERGKVQIYFAVKEIQDYLQTALGDISTQGENRFNPGLYFDKTFGSILNHTIEVLDNAHQKPAKKDNVAKIETMLGLAQEVKFFNENLKDSGVEVMNIDALMNEIREKYQKVLDLKPHYSQLESLQPFASYEDAAKTSVLSQLSEPYEFNYSKLAEIYFNYDDWMPTLRQIRDEQKDIDTDPNFKFNSSDSQELKDNFLKQFKSFNRLFKNGVVNYTLASAAALSKEAFTNLETSKVSAQSYFDREIGYHQKSLKSIYGDYKGYHQKQINELEKNKENYINKKNDDKVFHEEYLTVVHRQEQNIYQSLDKVKAKLFNKPINSTLTLSGNIKEGFVVGQFSNNDDVLLVHKDTTVNAVEAVYAMLFTKEQYDSLVANNQMTFDLDFKHNTKRKTGSNFFNYGQFLQEMSDPWRQKESFGQNFDLVDTTTLGTVGKKRMISL